jgi:hypothetical protein
MKIRKETPQWFIISDTKINPQTFQKFADHIKVDAETNWIKANGKAQTVSPAEKLLETLALDFLNLPNDKPSNEFLSANLAKLEPLFDHFSASIIFDEVSHLFLQNLLLEKLDLHVNQKRCNDLAMWLPPAFEHPIVSTVYGRMIGEIAGAIENFVQEAQKNNVKPEDALKAAFTMMPMVQHSKIIVTTTMSSWRKILVSLSAFDKDIETRYVALHLLRDLKMRYFGFFCDLALQTVDEKVYGADSINNEGFWKTVRIVKKP